MSREIIRMTTATIGTLATFAVTNNVAASAIAPSLVYLIDLAHHGSILAQACLPTAADAFTAYISRNITDHDPTTAAAGLIAYGLTRIYAEHLTNRDTTSHSSEQMRMRSTA